MPNVRKGLLLFIGAVLLSLLVLSPLFFSSKAIAAPSKTTTTVTIDNPGWAGYAASGSPFPTPSQPTKVLYSRIKGSWQMPVASCFSGEHSKAAFWVGLGGITDLEQIGTLIQCDDGVLQYDAVYELIQGAPGTVVFLKDKHPTDIVMPQDNISAEVHYLGKGHYKLSITDTGHWSFTSPVLSGSAADDAHNAADWIAEAPTLNNQVVPLTNFDRVFFSGCKADAKPITNGPTINDFLMTDDGNTIKAAASPLDSTGTAFNVTVPQS